MSAPARPTPAGVLVIAAAALCWGIGLLAHLTELNAVALTLTAALLIASPAVLRPSACTIALDMHADRGVAGGQVIGRLLITNASARRTPPWRIELVAGEEDVQLEVPALAPGAEHEELFAVPSPRRGLLCIGPVRSMREDSLALLRRRITWRRGRDLPIHPRTAHLAGSGPGLLRDLEGDSSAEPSRSDLDFHDLRDHVPGDDPRHVHWRTTARTGRLMARRFEESRRAHVLVAVDTAADRYGDPEDFELAVSAAASICDRALREETELTALTPDGPPRTASRRALMDHCTLLETTPAGARLSDLGRLAAHRAPDASIAVLVIGARTSPQELHGAVARLPVGSRTIAIRCQDGVETRCARLGRLALIDLGALADLPRALRAAAA